MPVRDTASHLSFMHQFSDSMKATEEFSKNKSRLFLINETCDYIEGYIEPHFPVPALRITANIYSDDVEIMQDRLEDDFPFDHTLRYWERPLAKEIKERKMNPLWPDERQNQTAVSRMYDYNTWSYMYRTGYREPRFPVPAIPTRIGYHPSGVNEMEGVPYIYVSTDTYLQTFWKDYGLFEEWSS